MECIITLQLAQFHDSLNENKTHSSGKSLIYCIFKTLMSKKGNNLNSIINATDISIYLSHGLNNIIMTLFYEHQALCKSEDNKWSQELNLQKCNHQSSLVSIKQYHKKCYVLK